MGARTSIPSGSGDHEDGHSARGLDDPHERDSHEHHAPERKAEMQAIARHNVGIGHITIQAEMSLAGCTERHHVGHLMARRRTGRKKKWFALA